MAGGTDGYVFGDSFSGGADIYFGTAGDAFGMGGFSTATHANAVLFDTLIGHVHEGAGRAIFFFPVVIDQSIDVDINPLSEKRLDDFDTCVFRKKVNVINDDFLDRIIFHILQYFLRLVLSDVDDGKGTFIMGTGVTHAAITLGFGFKYKNTEVEGGEHGEKREELSGFTSKHGTSNDGKFALKRF